LRRLSISVGESVPANSEGGLSALVESIDGREIVWGRFVAPKGRILIRDRARFEFTCESETVLAYADPLASDQAVRHSFYSAALPLIVWACDDLEAFHASGVRTPTGVIALCGPSESGKSTLAHALTTRGYEQFAEDAVAYDARTGVQAHPLPFTASLRQPSREYFSRLSSDPPPEVGVRLAESGATTFASVVLLNPVDLGRPKLEQQTPTDALLSLLPNAHRFKGCSRERERRMHSAYLTLVAETPVFRLSYARRFDELGEVLDCIETTIGR
jgi:hypothetical protein